MIETTDIYRSIREVLEKTFSNIPVQTKDLKTPNPPCFYIQYIGGVEAQIAEEFKQDEVSFGIIYFASDEKLVDLLRIKNKLASILKKPLKIRLSDNSETKTGSENSRTRIQYQEINNVSINLNEQDYILNCTISMTVDQRLEYKYEAFEIKDKDGNIITVGSKNRFDEYENEEIMDKLEYTI